MFVKITLMNLKQAEEISRRFIYGGVTFAYKAEEGIVFVIKKDDLDRAKVCLNGCTFEIRFKG